MLKNYAVCYIVLQESILCLYGGYLQVSRGPFLNKRNTEQDLDNDYGVSVVSLFYYCPMLQLLQGIYIVSAGYPECVGCLWVFSQCISDRSVKPKKWHLLSAVFSQELHYKIFGEGSKVVWAVSGSVWRVSWGWVVESILTLSEGGGMVSAGCLDYVWMVSGSVFWVTICVLSSLGHNQAKKLHLSSAVFSHKLHSRIFWEVLKVVWIVSGSVWRVSLDCLVESTLRQVIPTTKRLLYKSTVFSTSAPSQHFSRVAEWCLEGVWRVSGGCLKGEWECAVSDYECLAKVLVINMLDQTQKLGLKAPASSCALSPSQL